LKVEKDIEDKKKFIEKLNKRVDEIARERDIAILAKTQVRI